jgi:hypothetical protein
MSGIGGDDDKPLNEAERVKDISKSPAFAVRTLRPSCPPVVDCMSALFLFPFLSLCPVSFWMSAFVSRS